MNWFEGIEKGTLLKIELNNNEKIKVYFVECNNEIATCKLPNGKLKRILQNRIVDLEEIDEEDNSKASSKLSEKSVITSNNLDFSLSFLNKIENNILTPIPNIDKNTFLSLKSSSKQVYNQVINLYNNQYSHAKKIKELDLKYNRVQKILQTLDDILEEEYYEEVDLFLANVLKDAKISYFQFFKKEAYDLYCLKYDIFYCNQKNINFGFLFSEELFKRYPVNEKTISEWYFFVKNALIYRSFYIFEKIKDKIDKKLLEDSINYLLKKMDIDKNFTSLEEKIDFLTKLAPFENYTKLKKEFESFIAISDTSKKDEIKIANSIEFGTLGESLLKIVEPKINEENEKLLKPFGEIKTYFHDRGFGFIKDKNGSNIYFNIKDVNDEVLKNELLSTNKINRKLKVCYSTDFNYKGEIAKAIQKPKKIKYILEQIENLEKKSKFQEAYYLTQQILKEYPEHIKAKMLFAKFNSKINKNNNNLSGGKSIYGNYRKAKDAKDRKDYETAIKYYNLALENKEKLESTIKDLALVYYEIGDIEASKKLLSEWEDQLSKTPSTYNFLENHYFTLGEYEKALKYINILLNITNNTNREIILLGKKASCYIKLNNKEKAEEILNEILLLQPENTYAKKLLEDLKNSGKIENIDIEISSFGGGLSKYLEDTLNEYEEYAGVPPKIKEKKEFNFTTLREIRKLIETAGKARPAERAKYLLTEAKLMREIEPNKEIELKRALFRYCNAMALSYISENASMDVVRFFYLESFGLENEWQALAPQISLYMLSLSRPHQDLIGTKSLSIEKTLEEVVNQYGIENILINMFIKNEIIFNYFLKKFFEYQIKFKSLDLKFSNFNYFKRSWENILNKRKREYSEWISRIKSLQTIDNIELLSTQIEAVLNDLDKEWLCDLDKERLKTIKEKIITDLESYLKQKTFDDKERIKNYLLTKIDEMLNDIKKYPTKLSYEYYKPLLEFLERIVRRSFQNILSASKPKINITILNEPVIEKNTIEIQLEMSNEANSAPASKIVLIIKENKGIVPIEKEIPIHELLRGGQKKIQKISLRISDEVAKNRVADLHLILEYKNSAKSEEQYTQEFKLPIRLYSSEEFITIDNPYAPVAEGGPVKDEKMFFGRYEYINNIVESLLSSQNSKSIIIYGQKRSGKSTVLYHLKKRLSEKENTFCIDFSIGDIIDNLETGSAGFYYKILSQIEEELENLEFEGKTAPAFEKPSINELLKSPAIVFDEKLKSFYKSMQKLEEWKNKKLVILIDEFTYIYSAIMKKQIPDNFMKTWKALLEKNIFSAVLVGQDITPKFKSMFPNEFGITEDKRLTYLSADDAKRLIEEPIWDKEKNTSRYVGNAVNKIIQYTACNPYYLQMFCARMVDYMNEKKAIKVTEADVEAVFETFIEGSMSLQEDKFDNLLTAGDADIDSFNIKDVKNILYKIAKVSQFSGYCDKNEIEFEDKNLLENILEDLLKRDVIFQKEQKFKIKVELFEKWLLKNM